MSRQSKILNKFLKKSHMSQAELARRLSISRSHLCKVISGERQLSSEKLYDASAILGVPMEAFFQ